MKQDRRWTPREHRSASWVNVELAANAMSSAGVITNISKRGCRIRSEGRLQTGETIEVAIPGLGRVAALVRWAFGGYAGAEFLPGTESWEQIEGEPS